MIGSPVAVYLADDSCLVSDSTWHSLRSADVQMVWYHEHTAAMATELLQPLDLVCGTPYRSNCTIQTHGLFRRQLGTMDMELCDF